MEEALTNLFCQWVFSFLLFTFNYISKPVYMLLYYNLFKGESVAAAILGSGMEQSYCTSRFFRIKARQGTVSSLSRLD